MRHRIASPLLLPLLSTLLASCSIARPECGGVQLSKRQLIQIVELEIKSRGGEPAPDRRSKVEIKRDGCDYLYHEVYLPQRPGGHLFVRLDRNGKVMTFMPGA